MSLGHRTGSAEHVDAGVWPGQLYSLSVGHQRVQDRPARVDDQCDAEPVQTHLELGERVDLSVRRHMGQRHRVRRTFRRGQVRPVQPD